MDIFEFKGVDIVVDEQGMFCAWFDGQEAKATSLAACKVKVKALVEQKLPSVQAILRKWDGTVQPVEVYSYDYKEKVFRLSHGQTRWVHLPDGVLTAAHAAAIKELDEAKEALNEKEKAVAVIEHRFISLTPEMLREMQLAAKNSAE